MNNKNDTNYLSLDFDQNEDDPDEKDTQEDCKAIVKIRKDLGQT